MHELVSIYIPTRNRSDLVQRAIESALAQRGVDVEVIVVDDGSSDATQAVLSEIEHRTSALKVLRNDVPKGASAARNRALWSASGMFITGLDDDDTLDPDHVRGLRAAFRPGLAFVCSSRLEISRHGAVPNTLDAGPITLDRMLHYNRVGNQVFTLTERLREVGGFDESLPAFQDYDLWVRLLARYGDALKTSAITYEVRVDHDYGRISTSPERVLKALTIFRAKHAPWMSPRHERSMQLLEHKLAGRRLGLGSALRLAHRDNLAAVTSLYVNTNAPWVQRAYHALRRVERAARAGRR
ncbi:MAG: glycosyltransferase [Myxococcales bacterium]|nr:glycosyltransferase [Myxococcales bacterium]MDD9966815.1 glycosyltransferase [Myxococcales bacterium]